MSFLSDLLSKLTDPVLNLVARTLDRVNARPVLDYDRTPDRRWTATGTFQAHLYKGVGDTRRAAVVSCLTQATQAGKYSGPI